MLTGAMKRVVAVTAALVAGSLSTAQAASVLDLRVAGNNSGFQTAALGGRFYETTDDTQGTGSGDWHAFLRVDAQGNNTSEQGYNTETNKVFDNVDGTNTHTIPLSLIPTVTSADGHVYRVLGLDINQDNPIPGRFLSLNQVQIFASTTDPGASNTLTAATATTPPQIAFGAGFTELFRMNNSSNPNYFETQLNSNLSEGSGHDNMLLYVNNEAFAGLAGTTLITLYSQFGSAPGLYPTNDGFEEWAAITSGTIPSPPNLVPEPSTFLLACISGLMVLGYAWCRKAKIA
jgi:hypothetical protein